MSNAIDYGEDIAELADAVAEFADAIREHQLESNSYMYIMAERCYDQCNEIAERIRKED